MDEWTEFPLGAPNRTDVEAAFTPRSANLAVAIGRSSIKKSPAICASSFGVHEP
jgi:hypothetical protein